VSETANVPPNRCGWPRDRRVWHGDQFPGALRSSSQPAETSLPTCRQRCAKSQTLRALSQNGRPPARAG
jgi:hypothetical protein